MKPMANQAFDVRPNVLRGETRPNTLGGLGLPAAAARLALPPSALVAAAVVILAGLALALALGRAA